MKNVAIVTTMWAKVTRDEGEWREQELRTDERFFKPALDEQAKLARYHNTEDSAREILCTMLKNNPLALSIQREVIDDHKDLHDTMAGKEIQSQSHELICKANEEAQKLAEEIETAHQKDIGWLQKE
jgi:hypothetical protein